MEPKIRYNGYTNKWDDVCLNDIVSTAGIKNRENLPLVSFSITNDQGFVPQDDKFENGGTMRDANKSMYYIVSPKTFAYNPARINVGSIGYYDLEKDVIISSLYVVFKTDQEKCDDYYFLQWFKSDKFKRLIEQYQEGGVRLYFFYDKLCKCHVHIPSKEEQHKISSYFRVLDFKLQASAKKVESLKKLKSASLVAMFPQNGESMPKVRFKGFEGEWEKVKLGNVCSVNRGTRITKKELNTNHSYPVYQNTNYPLGYYKDYNVEANNPYVIIGGSAGLIGFSNVPFWAADDCAYFGDNDSLDKTFLYSTLLFHIAEIKRNVRGSSVPRLDRSTLIDLEINLPSFPEQQSIASYFRSLDRKIALETARLEKLKQIKLACLDKMFV